MMTRYAMVKALQAVLPSEATQHLALTDDNEAERMYLLHCGTPEEQQAESLDELRGVLEELKKLLR